MNNLENKRVLITGASSGIGLATAKALRAKNCELFLLARREEKLKEVQKLLGSSSVHILPMDINDPALKAKVEDFTKMKLDILINNAGLALGREKLENADFRDIETMISTNVTSTFKLSHLVVPWMIKAGGGDILNVCSIAGHYTYIGGAVYSATKHAVHAFTRALREETVGKKMRIMQISPGMVDTEFSTVRFRGDKTMADSVYAGMTPLTPEDVARMMVFMLSEPSHVVIDELITMPTHQGSISTIYRGGV